MAVMIIQLFQFIFYIAMSAVVNTQVVLRDIRQADIEDIKKAVVFGMRLDDTETSLMYQMFDVNLNKLYQMNSENLQNMNDVEIKFIQIELLLKISKKIKMMMTSIEEFLSHDAIIDAKFEYDEPQQRLWNEAQNYLNQLAASDALDRVL